MTGSASSWYPSVVATERPIAHDQIPDSTRPVVVARRVHEDGAPVPTTQARHRAVTHSYAALAFFTAGSARVEQNGRWDVAPGDVLLVPAGQPHKRLEGSRPEYWGLSFCVPCVASEGGARLLEPFERVRDGGAAVVRIPAARHPFLDGLFRELEAHGRERDLERASGAAVERSLLTLILHEVERATPSLTGEAEPHGGLVTACLRFIERNCLGRLTLTDVATAVGRSPAHVTSVLSRATGRSAVAWIIAGRMAEARRLLLHSSERIDEIASRVGYADPTHFIRMFRREHGATPAAWRATQAR